MVYELTKRAWAVLLTVLEALALLAVVPHPFDGQSTAGYQGNPPRVLIIVAHPDDESCFAATVYQITHNLAGTVDQLVITDGEGGFRYSLVAETYYHVQLTTEAVGRSQLPDIRRRELLNAGAILGISDHFFLDEKDLRYTKDIDEVLTQHWRLNAVRSEVSRRLEDRKYDFVLTLFPTEDTHGAHKAATMVALDAVQTLQADRPVVLGCQDSSATDKTPLDWKGFQSASHPFSVEPQRYSVDRTVKFGFNNVLDYQIIVNWVIAEHKSQGAFQQDIDRYQSENFAVLETGTADSASKAAQLFQALAAIAPHPAGLDAQSRMTLTAKVF